MLLNFLLRILLNFKNMDIKTRKDIESLVFKKLVKHFRQNTKVQNIDLMNLSCFCRNCLSKWYVSAAEKQNLNVNYEEARELIYGMPYPDWKKKYQT